MNATLLWLTDRSVNIHPVDVALLCDVTHSRVKVVQESPDPNEEDVLLQNDVRRCSEQPKVKQINKSIVIKMQIVNPSVVDVVTVSAILPII